MIFTSFLDCCHGVKTLVQAVDVRSSSASRLTRVVAEVGDVEAVGVIVGGVVSTIFGTYSDSKWSIVKKNQSQGTSDI